MEVVIPAADWSHLPAALQLSADWHVRDGRFAQIRPGSPNLHQNRPQAETSPVGNSGSIRPGRPSSKWVSFDLTGALVVVSRVSFLSVTILCLMFEEPWTGPIHSLCLAAWLILVPPLPSLVLFSLIPCRLQRSFQPIVHFDGCCWMAWGLLST